MKRVKLYNINKKTFLGFYPLMLDRYIDIVLKKTDTNDEGITWYICKEDDLYYEGQSKNVNMKKDCLFINNKYGCTNVYTKEIWISIEAVKTGSLFEVMADGFIKNRKVCTLTDVIIDELTHVITGKNHNDPDYGRCREELIQKYKG